LLIGARQIRSIDRLHRRVTALSRNCGQRCLLLIPPVSQNEGDLNENNRTRCGHGGKDVFAKAFVPEFVHGRTETNECQAPDIESKLNKHRDQAGVDIGFHPVRSVQHRQRYPAQ
jgi:hypothetical protein